MFSGFARWIGFLTMTAGLVGVILFTGGFFWFVSQVSDQEASVERKADGIVVLTGAAARIPDAIELLATDRGKRLLITGVHRDTRMREIARLTPLYSKYFTCCIDLDRSALNTFGNALETKHWATEHNFNSLIVVTSNWHMPRAMAEMQHQLPLARLIAYPVVSERAKAEAWWSNGESVKLLVSEYVKYLFALARMHLDTDGA